MEHHGVARVLARNQFYWESYRRLSIIFVLMLFLVLVLSGLIFYQRVVWPKPKYFATTPDGRPIAVVRLDEPLYADPAFVLDWASRAVLSIYALDYVTWRYTLQSMDSYFTPKGYQDFLAALKISTNLEAIKAKRQVVSAQITAPPTLNRAGQVSADVPYSWDLQMPATVIYQNSENEIIQQKGVVLMRVERASLLRYKEGLAISQLVFQTNT